MTNETRTTESENKEQWYKSLENPDGIYVTVKTYNPDTGGSTIVFGRLNQYGGLQLGNDYMQVLDYSTITDQWERHTMVDSIKYVWDELTYEMIPAHKIKVGDFTICNFTLCPITGTLQGQRTRIKYQMNGKDIVEDYDGYALRKKPGPTTPGLYKDKHGDYCILNPEDNCWYECSPSLSKDKAEPEHAPYRLVSKLIK
ncbi:hypothetical protein BLBA0010001c01_00011 [Bifidobacterium phage BlindBasel1]|nr:hypothetical protein BLBA0010001c01_00011 [Bifidobacterium phage BlindBasel1]